MDKPNLQKKYDGSPEIYYNYFRKISHSFNERGVSYKISGALFISVKSSFFWLTHNVFLDTTFIYSLPMIEIINLEGEVIFKCKHLESMCFEDLDTTRFPRGVYFVKIQINDCIETKKLLVS